MRPPTFRLPHSTSETITTTEQIYSPLPLVTVDDLNPPQREAVLHHRGPLLVLAGAGSGKTRVLTHRVAHLINHHGEPPDSIVAVTFTNRAAAEMRHRIHSLLDDKQAAQRVVISTFHSLGARLLRRLAPRAGLDWNFTIYDDGDQRRLISSLLDRLGEDRSRGAVRQRQHFIDAQKNRGWTPDQAQENAFGADAERLAGFYDLYQDELRRQGGADFGDLLLQVLVVLRQDPALAKRLSRRWRFLMVDEFQDTNPAQNELLVHLTTAHDNLAVVGDDDQAIYGWRGAEPAHILGFEDTFQSARVIKLEQNYRSTSGILDAANDVIAHNPHRHSKRLWTDRPEGDPLVVFQGRDDREEAAYVAERIFELLRSGSHPEDIAIFYRTNAQGRLFEEQLRQWGHPYRIVGGLSFYARQEIKDILAYLRAALNPRDDVATTRILNTPKRGIGSGTLDKLSAVAALDGVFGLQDALTLLDTELPPQSDLFHDGPRPRTPSEQAALDDLRTLRGVGRRGLEEFRQILDDTREDLLHYDRLTPVVERLLERIAYQDYLAKNDPETAEDRLQNIGELLNAVEEFHRDPNTPALLDSVRDEIPEGTSNPLLTADAPVALRAFLDRSALIQDTSTDADRDSGAVTLMTVHSSKGLEFDTVFLVGLEEELFPSLRNDSPEGLEEERRLAYVAITRARDRLFLCSARRRRVHGTFRNTRPSRFLSEINPDRLAIDPRSAHSPLERPFEPRPALTPQSFSSTFEPPRDDFPDAFNQAPPDWDNAYTADEAHRIVTAEPTQDDSLLGATVSHSRFGIGEVIAVSGSGDKAHVTVEFPSLNEEKTVIRRFLKVLA